MVRLLIVGCLLTVAASACGGGGDLTVEEYFQRVDGALSKLALGTEQIAPDPNATVTTDAEAIDTAAGSADAGADLIEQAADDLRDINAPKVHEPPHEEFIAALDELAAVTREFEAQLRAAPDRAELARIFDEFLTGERFTAARQRVFRACIAIQRNARDNGVPLETDC